MDPQALVDHRPVVPAHLGRPDRVEDGGADVAGRLGASSSSLLSWGPGLNSSGRKRLRAGAAQIRRVSRIASAATLRSRAVAR
jgi:hypothetical protein